MKIEIKTAKCGCVYELHTIDGEYFPIKRKIIEGCGENNKCKE